jgi:hypothetical protein
LIFANFRGPIFFFEDRPEEVSSNGMEKCVERRNWRQIAPWAIEKPNVDRKKRLASVWSRQRITKITKKARPVVGQKPMGNPDWKANICTYALLDPL